MSQPSPSLRDLYSTPPEIWAFPSQAGSSDVLVDVARFDQKDEQNLSLNQLLLTGLLQYSTTAVAMPWEVGKLLLQIQSIPRDATPRQPPLGKARAGYEAEDEDNVGCLSSPHHL